MDDPKALGLRLQRAREDAGLDQPTVAKRIGVHAVTLSRWENGKYPIRRVMVRLLAELYGVPEERLLGEDSEPGATVVPPSEAPRHARNQPLAVREFLATARLEMTKAGATDEEIAGALALMQSEVNFVHAHGGTGAMREFNESDVLKSMRAIYNGRIKRQLRAWGREIK